MSTIIEMANAVVEELADYSAELQFAPDFDLPRLATRRVVVVPIAKEYKLLSRSTSERIHRIEIGVLQRAQLLDLDALISMVENIGMSFLGKRLLTGMCVSVSFEPIYSPEDLRSKNQFTSVIALSFKEIA